MSAGPIPASPGNTLYLSNLDDMIEARVFTPTVYLCRSNCFSPGQKPVTKTLHDALASVLVPYYPFSGRLRGTKYGKLEVFFGAEQGGLAKVLKGKDKKPETIKEDEWEELESRCVSTNRPCIADNIINNVMDEDLASALWEKLEKLYLAKSLTNKLHLKRQLYKMKIEEGRNLMEHMNVFNGYLDQLRKIDAKIEEEDKALLLLTSLPNSYDILATTLLYEKDTVSLEQVQSVLVSHCTKKRSSFKDGESATLAIQRVNRGKKSNDKSGGSNESNSNSRGKGVQCYYCKEFGHVKRDCPLRKNKGKKCDDASSCNSLVIADDGDLLTSL
ncbi:hypothetical protein Acr_01g0007590 [Actinidia rufa]|uniref:CCHC-type domain-containing protein n=1 Tax=Actinidia rufa TaxID=165716 RepID=A0A7J0E3F7_9ERIC|nr:hypothetical protein Acr_01g0007590 [Actinidia rufa]